MNRFDLMRRCRRMLDQAEQTPDWREVTTNYVSLAIKSLQSDDFVREEIETMLSRFHLRVWSKKRGKSMNDDEHATLHLHGDRWWAMLTNRELINKVLIDYPVETVEYELARRLEEAINREDLWK